MKAVFFTDGSAIGRSVGYGIHGYTYEESDKPISGPQRHIVTNRNYILRSEAKEDTVHARPIEYIDVYVSDRDLETNNQAELLSIIEAMKIAKQKGVTKLLIHSDSEYAIKGITEYLSTWIKNGFINSQGKPVANKNLWKKYLATEEQCEFEFEIVKIAAHAGNIGNDCADMLAGIGSMKSLKKIYTRKEVVFTDIVKYWKNQVSKPPLLIYKDICMHSLRTRNVEGTYCLVDPLKDSTNPGKKCNDTGYGVVRMKETDPHIDKVMDYLYSKESDMDRSQVLMVHLSNLYSPSIARLIDMYGLEILNDRMVDHVEIIPNRQDRKPIATEYNPPLMIQKAFEFYRELDKILDIYDEVEIIDGVYSGVVSGYAISFTNINSFFYEDKKSKGIKLLPDLKVGTKNCNVTATSVDGTSITVPMELGRDMPDRNALARLAKENVELYLVVWNPIGKVLRYAVIADIPDGYGIYTNTFTNVIL